MKIKGIFLPFKTTSDCKRRYEIDSLDSSVIITYTQKINNNQAFGEQFINREINNNNKKFKFISLDHISHKVNKIYITNEGIKGEAQLLDTPQGKFVKKLMDNNYKLVLRPRISGYVDAYGIVRIKDIISFDIIDESTDMFNEYNQKNKRFKLSKNEK